MREVVAKLVTEANEIVAELFAKKDIHPRLIELAVEMRDSLERWLKVLDEGDDA